MSLYAGQGRTKGNKRRLACLDAPFVRGCTGSIAVTMFSIAHKAQLPAVHIPNRQVPAISASQVTTLTTNSNTSRLS